MNNPPLPSHQNPKQTPSALPQVNPAMNQQMCPNGNVNAGGLFPNNMSIVAPLSPFMNFPNQPATMQFTNGQFPNVGVIGGFNPNHNFGQFPINQFNPAQQQQQQQALMQSTIQNIYQLIQLQQNTNNVAQRPPMFHNQMANVMNPPNLGFLANQQFNGPPMQQHVNPNMSQQLQGNPFLPGSVQMQQPQNLIAPFPNFQNQMVQGVSPQNHNFPTNQMFGMPNMNGPVQLVNQGQQRFISPMVNSGQTQNPTNFEANNGNVPSNKNGGWAESQHKNFTGHKNNDAPHIGFKSNRHAKDKYGMYNGNMNKEGNSNGAVDSGPRNSTNVEKIFSINYTEQEIKQWREARKKNFPTVLKKCTKENTLSDATDQEAILRRQQLKEVLAKQAELGLEVAEVPSHYLSDPENQNLREKNSYGPHKQNPKWKKHDREHFNKKGKFNNKRGTRFQDKRINKRAKQGHQHAVKRDPSLLKKLLARDIKRDKNHLLQVFRFMTVNSFFTGESNKSLKFPSVIVRETNPNVPKETTCSVSKDIEKAEEEEDEEEGELTD